MFARIPAAAGCNRILWRHLCLAAILVTSAIPSSAWSEESVSFRRLAIPDDVPAHLCTALAEDRDGFVWIGTQSGLARYDGYTFRGFRSDPDDETTLGGSDVRTIHVARDGRLWIGTFGDGVSVFDPATERFRRFRHDPIDPESLSNDRVDAIVEDGGGSVWIATDHGLDHLDVDGRFEHFRADPTDRTALAERVRGHDEPLVSTLLDEIRAFRLDEVLSLVERADGQ